MVWPLMLLYLTTVRSIYLTLDTALVAGAPPPFRWKPSGMAGSGLLLGVWLLAGWLIAMAARTSQARAQLSGAASGRATQF